MIIIINCFLAMLCYNYIKDKALLSETTLKQNLKQFFIGTLMATSVMGIIYSLYFTVNGQLEVEQLFRIQLLEIILAFTHYFFVALFEEAFFRGIILLKLAKKIPAVFAVVISALIFALPHLVYQQSIMSITSVFLGGILLGSMVIRDRSLWSAVGFHLFWNLLGVDLSNKFLWDKISLMILLLTIGIFVIYHVYKDKKRKPIVI